MKPSGKLDLQFFDDKPQSWQQCIARCLKEHGPAIRLRPWNDDARAFTRAVAEAGINAAFSVAREEIDDRDVPEAVSVVTGGPRPSGHVLFYKDPEELSEALLEFWTCRPAW